MTSKELAKVLADHKAWLATDGRDGKRADLCDADLYEADLRGADLCDANLSGTNLRGADLRGADLHRANLCGADLHGADLRNAKLDYSCWPLWCGSLDVTIDAWQAAQLMYHTLRAMQSVTGDADVEAVLSNPAVIRFANRFLRAGECGKINRRKGGAA